MRATVRLLLAVFLSLLLPLQAGSALARSVAMAASGHPVPAVAAMPATRLAANRTDAPPSLTQPVGGSHPQAAHAHHAHHHVTKSPPSGKDENTHKIRHAKGHCNDCGKCCMTAVVAPPPAVADSFQPSPTRASWLPYRLRITLHVPDGPERPPRSLTA